MMLDVKKIQVIAFDLFGTVYDMKDVPREEMRYYGEQLRRPKWAPLALPESWAKLPLFPDSLEAIPELMQHYTVVTLSNAPLGLQIAMTKNSGLRFHGMIPLEIGQTYKPRVDAYRLLAAVMNVPPENCLMVTANKTFGDIEGSRSIGMQAALVRSTDDGAFEDISDLEDQLFRMRTRGNQ